MHGSRTTVIAVLALTLFAAAAHGVVTNRWTGGHAAAELPPIPKQFGDWVGEDQESVAPEPGVALLSRTYSNAKAGRAFTISLSVGHPGLTGVHTPEYCYRGRGFEVDGGFQTRAVTGAVPGTFWTARFRKSTSSGNDQLRIFWAWSAGAPWAAPDHPRLHFLGARSLYKLYVVAGGAADAAPGADPVLDEFLTGLLATLHDALFIRPAA